MKFGKKCRNWIINFFYSSKTNFVVMVCSSHKENCRKMFFYTIEIKLNCQMFPVYFQRRNIKNVYSRKFYTKNLTLHKFMHFFVWKSFIFIQKLYGYFCTIRSKKSVCINWNQQHNYRHIRFLIGTYKSKEWKRNIFQTMEIDFTNINHKYIIILLLVVTSKARDSTKLHLY